MIRISGLAASLLAALLCLLAASTAQAADCSLTVKNCIPNPDGSLRASAYNGNDSSKMIPASTSGNLSHGQSAGLSCNYSYCDLRLTIQDRPGAPNRTVPYDDACRNVTLQRTRTGDAPDVFKVELGVQACRFNGDGSFAGGN